MNIYYDNIIFSIQKAGGISVYWYELINRLLQNNMKVKFIEQKDKENIFREKIKIYKTNNILKEGKIPIKILRYIPLTLKLPKKSIFHSSYYRISKQKDVINIVTVHDFTYEYFKRGLPKWIHYCQKKYAIKNADGIICVSHNTKKDLFKFFPYINEEKVKVIYNGVSNEFYNLENDNSEFGNKYKNQKYILYVGDRSNYKNFKIAVDVLSQLDSYKLVIVGGKDFSNDEKMNLNKKLRNRYEHLKGLSVEKLNILYNYAHCLLYPSSYEGFGIPVIEAMKAGCPVVSTNFSSIPEIAGDTGLLVKEIKVENFVEKIKMLKNNQFRNQIIEKGYKQSKKFSWDKTYYEHIDFYKQIYNSKFKGE